MSQTLTVQLSDTTFAVLEEWARAVGQSPAELAASAVKEWCNGRNGVAQDRNTMTEEEKQAARERFERHFGEVSLGYPIATDNEALDEALGREYMNNHENE